MFIKSFSPLFRRYRLFSPSSHATSFYNVSSVSVRKNISVPSHIPSYGQGNQRTKVPSSISNLSAFRLYLKGHNTEPYGKQGKESRDLFIQTLTKTFESVAEAHRRLRIHSSDTPKSINIAEFLSDVFVQVPTNFMQQSRSFAPSVSISYSKWIISFMYDHVYKMNNFRSERSTSESMLQNSVDSVEMFLEDYFRGIPDQTELKTRTNQIVDNLFHCMEDYLSHPGIEQGLDDEGLSAGISGLVDMNTQEERITKLFPEDWQNAWKQPFRGKSLMLLKQKLALNVDALQRVKRPSRKRISKLEMSRIIPITQSSGTGKSRLAEEYDSSDMLCNT